MQISRKTITAGITLLWMAVFAFSFSVYPNFDSVRYILPGKSPIHGDWPFRYYDVTSGQEEFKLVIPIKLGNLHSRIFSIYTDNPIKFIEVNGAGVRNVTFPLYYHLFTPEPINLENSLRPGRNEFSFKLENFNGSCTLRISVNPFDPLHLIFVLLVLFTVALTFNVFRQYFPFAVEKSLLGILFFGLALRILYFCWTPYYLRAHDLGGHLEYSRYIAKFFALPPPLMGWETHQAPLYYIITGFYLWLANNDHTSWLYGQLSFFALLLSCISLIVSVRIVTILFPKEEQSNRNWLFILISIYPALLFYATRISNDVLLNIIAFVWFLFLLRWWKDSSLKDWLILSITLGIAFITKNGALILMSITMGCMILKYKKDFRILLQRFALLCVILLLLAGWYQIPRLMHAVDASQFVIGNHMDQDGLRINPTLRNLFTFNPLEVIRLPFNNPWSDEFRRQYFLEYFYKSSFFGEWKWQDYLLLPARAVVISGMLLFAMMPIGIFKAWRMKSRYFTPVLLSGLGMFASIMLYTVREPYACNEDFRYFVLLVIPIGYFAILGSEVLGIVGKGILGLFSLHVILFLVLLLLL